MPRRGRIVKRDVLQDPLYNSKLVTRLINNVMLDGKKSIAQKIVYGAFDIKIKIDGAVYHRTVSGKTVKDAISKVDLNISEDDQTNPGPNAPLMNGIEIEVIKVKTKVYTVTEKLSYTTKYVYTDELAAGKTRVKVEGQNGTREITYKESYITKGDANKVVDANPVHSKNVIGKPIFNIPYLGYVSNYIQTPPGMYVAIGVCALLVLMSFIPDLIFGKKDKKEIAE